MASNIFAFLGTLTEHPKLGRAKKDGRDYALFVVKEAISGKEFAVLAQDSFALAVADYIHIRDQVWVTGVLTFVDDQGEPRVMPRVLANNIAFVQRDKTDHLIQKNLRAQLEGAVQDIPDLEEILEP